MAHKLRFLSTALSIVLGMAFVTGTLVLGDTLNSAFTRLFGEIGAGIDVLVQPAEAFQSDFGVAQETRSIPDEVVERIADVGGVAALEPEYSGTAQLVDPEGEVIGGMGPPQIGVDAPTVEELGSVELREGRYPERSGEVAIDVTTATDEELGPGDTIGVAVDGPVQDMEIVGLVGYPGLDDLAGATLALFDDASARELFGQDGAASVAVGSDDGVDTGELRADISEEVGADYEVLTGEQAAESSAQDVGQFLGFITTALLVFAGVALFVGSFLIFNTFTITVAQRTRELALLRAVGASRRQVLMSVLGEALIVGVFGSLLGLLLGLGLASGLRNLLDAFGFSLPSADLVLAGRTVVVSLIVGPIITLLAALVPAIRATRVPPVAAMRTVALPPESGRGGLRLLIGTLVLAGGAAALGAGLFGGAELSVVGLGAVLVLLGVAALSPLVTRPIAGLLGAPVAAARGVSGTLARENATRNARRTASTAAALMIGLGLVTFVMIFADSLQASVERILDERFLADFQVQPVDFVGFPEAVGDELAEVEGVAAVSRTKIGTVGVDGNARTLGALDPETYDQVIAMEFDEGGLGGLTSGGVALSRDLASALGRTVGDSVDVAFRTPEQTQPLLIAGIYDPATIESGAQLMVSLERFAEAFPDQPDTNAFVLLDEGVTTEEIRPELDAVLQDYPTAALFDITEIRDEISEQTGQLLGLIFALLFFSIIIALFGIANTLGLSVLERTRELGLLRAIGMSREQVRAMVRWESVIISVFGALLGLVVGLFFGLVFIRALEDIGLEVFSVPVVSLVAAVVVAGIAGVLAAVMPGRRASRVDVLRAVQVE